MKWTNIFFAAILSFFAAHLSAQTPAPIIFIVDASGSMWGQIEGEAKMQIAKEVLNKMVGNMPDEQALGLVAYGHRKKGDCRDVEYLVEPKSTEKTSFQNELTALQPLGKTPLAYSAKLVIDELRKNGGKATVILVTDGIETCEGDLCQLVKDAKAEGIEFKMHIVGFDLKPEEKAALQCAAAAGDGDYLDAANAEELSDVLTNTTAETVDAPPANCLLSASKNGELIDAYVKILRDETDEEMPAQRTYSDTADFHLSPGDYIFRANIVGNNARGVGTVEKKVTVPEDAASPFHVEFSFDPGKVFVSVRNNGEAWDATAKVFPVGEQKALDGSRTYNRGCTFEVNAGTYELKVQPMKIKGPELEQIKTFTIQAHQTDTLDFDFASGEAWIGASHGGALVDATVNITSISPVQPVAGGRTYTSEKNNPRKFILLPGEYKVTLKALSDPVRGAEKEINITVKAGEEIRQLIEF